MLLRCRCASVLYPLISASRFFLVFSWILTRSACFWVAVWVLRRLFCSRSFSRPMSSMAFRSVSICRFCASISRSSRVTSPRSTSRALSTSVRRCSTSLTFFTICSLSFASLFAAARARLISSSLTLSSASRWEFSARSCVLVLMHSSSSCWSFWVLWVRASFSLCAFCTWASDSRRRASRRARSSWALAMASCFERDSSVRFSSCPLISRISLSRRSRFRCSRSSSALLFPICVRRASASASWPCFSDPSTRHRSCSSTISFRAVTSCWVRLSRSAVSSSLCLDSSLTVFSCPSVSPAPCSTRRERLVISSLSCWIVSLARCSFSCDASTIFQAFSISFLSDAMVFWSSWESLSAVCTLAALATISWFSSRHFLIRRFSLSCDFLRALCSFSYSTRKRSSDLSPTKS
mmetsp:Transcript_22991/g.48188  ORF Transcript_22991/g.48188 Transcript_22991/m.48188 type:complete len:408 (-) Transcript_22991:172-1395(-)